MIVRDNIYQHYPSKSVFKDLILRDGPVTLQSFTPYDGCFSVARDILSKGGSADNTPSVLELLLVKKELSFDRLKNLIDKHESNSVSLSSSTDGVMFLEDISPEYVLEQLKSDISNAYNNKTNSLKAIMRKRERVSAVFTDSDGDDVTQADLEVIDSSAKPETILNAREYIKYILLLYRDISIKLGATVLEALVELEYKRSVDNKSYRFKPELLFDSVFKIESNGRVQDVINSSKGASSVQFSKLKTLICNSITLEAIQSKFMVAIQQAGLSVSDFRHNTLESKIPVTATREYYENIQCSYQPTLEDLLEVELLYFELYILGVIESPPKSSVFVKQSQCINESLAMSEKTGHATRDIAQAYYNCLLRYRKRIISTTVDASVEFANKLSSMVYLLKTTKIDNNRRENQTYQLNLPIDTDLIVRFYDLYNSVYNPRHKRDYDIILDSNDMYCVNGKTGEPILIKLSNITGDISSSSDENTAIILCDGTIIRVSYIDNIMYYIRVQDVYRNMLASRNSKTSLQKGVLFN